MPAPSIRIITNNINNEIDFNLTIRSNNNQTSSYYREYQSFPIASIRQILKQLKDFSQEGTTHTCTFDYALRNSLTSEVEEAQAKGWTISFA